MLNNEIADLHIERRIICLQFDSKINLRLLFTTGCAAHAPCFPSILNICVNKLIRYHSGTDFFSSFDNGVIRMLLLLFLLSSFFRYLFDIVRFLFEILTKYLYSDMFYLVKDIKNK